MPSPIDLDLACAGYLRWPDGKVQHIIGLDRIAQDTRRADVPACWASPLCMLPGYYCEHRRCIMLAPWLYWCPPWFVRDVWTHELGHGIVGDSQDRARAWQARNYGELVEPVWA